MNAIAAGLAGALISGLAMYTVGAKANQVDAFTPPPASMQAPAPFMEQAQFVPVSNSNRLRPVAAPAIATSAPATYTRRAPAPRRSASSARVDDRQIDREIAAREDVRQERSWGKTAMVIGGSAASGAGVGGIVGGTKGALIGAAIGGGAASIYEATRDDRR